ncbi:MKP1 [Symbiodinium sp. CCMP2456]|nr:MKP1 [Symbiodinium sp. CCMP2456]
MSSIKALLALNTSPASSHKKRAAVATVALPFFSSPRPTFVSAPGASFPSPLGLKTIDSPVAREVKWKWVEPTVPEELVDQAKDEGFRQLGEDKAFVCPRSSTKVLAVSSHEGSK